MEGFLWVCMLLWLWVLFMCGVVIVFVIIGIVVYGGYSVMLVLVVS